MYDYLIVGAGLYGATLAYLLADSGKSVMLMDQRNHVAGNCYSYDYQGIQVHKYGAHIFHTNNKRVWSFVNEFSEFLPYHHEVVANYNGRMYNLPINMNTFYQMWKLTDPSEIKRKIDLEVKFEKSLGLLDKYNLESHAVSMVGRSIFTTLIEKYTEKQWGKKCSELPAYIIKRLPIRYTWNNSYFDDRYQGIPKDGYGELVNRILGARSIKLVLNRKFQLKDSVLAKKVIYTGSVDELLDYKLGVLEYRSLRFDTKVFNVNNYQGCSVINYTGNEPYTRIIEHKHFDSECLNDESSVVTIEYSDPWSRGKERYYPINNDRNNKAYGEYVDLLKSNFPNIILGGRLGEYKYYDMDDVIESTLNKFEELK